MTFHPDHSICCHAVLAKLNCCLSFEERSLFQSTANDVSFSSGMCASNMSEAFDVLPQYLSSFLRSHLNRGPHTPTNKIRYSKGMLLTFIYQPLCKQYPLSGGGYSLTCCRVLLNPPVCYTIHL